VTFIRFLDMMPPARSTPDNQLWTQYKIQSSTDGSNWVTFEGPSLLDPAYTDPANPESYNFTSVDAPVDAVYFRVVWIDGLGVEQETEPLTRPRELPAWAPSLGDVAEHIPLRTKTSNGFVVGTFTAETKPATADLVSRLIVKGVKRVRPLFEDPITDPTRADEAKDLAALWTAMLVELGLFSDQVQNDQSPYPQLKELWDDATGGGEGGAGLDGDDLLGRVAPSWQFETRAPLRW
jgi:hypothetical protein